jgi:hypothetical protein
VRFIQMDLPIPLEGNMTMIPPKIKKLPGLRKQKTDYTKNMAQGSAHSNRSLYMGGAKMKNV